MGVPWPIAWSVCLRDSNFRLGGTSFGWCDARCNNAGSKAFAHPRYWRGLPIQSLDSRLDVQPNLFRAYSAPVDELRVSATECLRAACSLGGPVCGVIYMEWDES